MVVVRRALLSCYEKTGLADFAKVLAGMGVELVASSGTGEFLRAEGLRVKSLEEFAGVSEQLQGRVKTLHPKIHAGILAKRDDPAHRAAVGSEALIDLVTVNLYPFLQTVQRSGVSVAEALEQIDIGGVALLRAAAKNFPFVAAVSHPRQYPEVLEALRAGSGQLPEPLSRRLANAAFELTSAYDRWIANFLTPDERSALPELLTLTAHKAQELRYGENPHQRAAWYLPAASAQGLQSMKQLQGKPLSYNNLLDLDAALRCLLEFDEPSCVIVKHASPCGVASHAAVAEAYRRAVGCDAESAFGGIVGLNRPIDRETADALGSAFLEVVVAPAVDPSAQGTLAKKPNLRLLTLDWPVKIPSAVEWRSLLVGWLLQEWDAQRDDLSSTRVVTKRQPTETQSRELAFAWRVVKHVKSNAIVAAKDGATVGIGQGQPSRVRAVALALQNADDRARGAVLASDGFFPFPDSIERAAEAGIACIIQPGGSLRDAEVIAACDRAGLAMVVTGVRHFRH